LGYQKPIRWWACRFVSKKLNLPRSLSATMSFNPVKLELVSLRIGGSKTEVKGSVLELTQEGSPPPPAHSQTVNTHINNCYKSAFLGGNFWGHRPVVYILHVTNSLSPMEWGERCTNSISWYQYKRFLTLDCLGDVAGGPSVPALGPLSTSLRICKENHISSCFIKQRQWNALCRGHILATIGSPRSAPPHWPLA